MNVTSTHRGGAKDENRDHLLVVTKFRIAPFSRINGQKPQITEFGVVMLDKNALDKLQAFGKALSADADQTLSEARAEHVASLKAEIDELNAELELMKEQARREVTDLYNTVSPRGMSALDQELDAYWSAHSDQTRPIRRRRDDLEREIDELS